MKRTPYTTGWPFFVSCFLNQVIQIQLGQVYQHVTANSYMLGYPPQPPARNNNVGTSCKLHLSQISIRSPLSVVFSFGSKVLLLHFSPFTLCSVADRYPLSPNQPTTNKNSFFLRTSQVLPSSLIHQKNNTPRNYSSSPSTSTSLKPTNS